MKALVDKHSNRHYVPCPYRKNQLESNHPEKLTKPHSFGFHQACSLLQAIELNNRKRLNKRCLGNVLINWIYYNN
jgi:retron-type reverse transcriptase